MRDRMLVVALALGLLVVLAVPALGLAASDDGGESAADTEATPGERLSGVVGVQDAELEGDLDQRTFGVAFANATTDEARADVVAARLDAVDERLDELVDRKTGLDERREAGEISDGQYNARVAGVAVATEAATRSVNQTERAAGELPAELLEERGVDAEAIQTLRERANELTGPEVAEIAREIAGPPDERPGGPPADVPAPDDAGPDSPSNESRADGTPAPDDAGPDSPSNESGADDTPAPDDRGDAAADDATDDV